MPRTHGMSRSRAFTAWKGCRQRCENTNNPNYPFYGARGIKVCERWQSFENFLADMGEPPVGASLDRIDNDGDYAPGNCRWATKTDQSRNRRNNRVYDVGGVSQPLSAWCEHYGLKYGTVHSRLRTGWTIEAALGLTRHPETA